MTAYYYDRTFDGLLSCVFEAFDRKEFPNIICRLGEPLPLFCDLLLTVATGMEQSGRVWRGLEKRLSLSALHQLTVSWLSEEEDIDNVMFRYICKTFSSKTSIEMNFGDPDVLSLNQTTRRVLYEQHRMKQFIRFQKAADGTYFAALEPMYNVLPLAIDHFRDRFSDQPWLIYDIKREYGYYYNMKSVERITFTEKGNHLVTGLLEEEMMANDERLFQELWRTYFKAICIKERLNPRKHRQDLPARFWKYLTEKQEPNAMTRTPGR